MLATETRSPALPVSVAIGRLRALGFEYLADFPEPLRALLIEKAMGSEEITAQVEAFTAWLACRTCPGALQ